MYLPSRLRKATHRPERHWTRKERGKKGDRTNRFCHPSAKGERRAGERAGEQTMGVHECKFACMHVCMHWTPGIRLVLLSSVFHSFSTPSSLLSHHSPSPRPSFGQSPAALSHLHSCHSPPSFLHLPLPLLSLLLSFPPSLCSLLLLSLQAPPPFPFIFPDTLSFLPIDLSALLFPSRQADQLLSHSSSSPSRLLILLQRIQMPLVETLESYSRALYLPLRGYVRRPFQFVTESIREHVPKGLWDIRRAMEHTVLGTSKLVGPFDGFISGNALTNNGSGIGGNAGAGVAGVAGSSLGGGAGSTTANAAAAAAANAASAASGYGSTGAGNAAARMLQVQPSLIQFFTSPYCLLLCFLVSVNSDGRRGRERRERAEGVH